MASYFVTRHQGAIEWARRRGIEAEAVAHLDLSRIERGDTVFGTLPINLVAEINAKGAHYIHLVLNVPAGARGGEHSVDDMERYKAKLIEYRAERVGPV